MWAYNYSDELYHYGVLGMKWGVRRINRAQRRSARLATKAAIYDMKSDGAKNKALQLHKANRYARDVMAQVVKSDALKNKAEKIRKKLAKNEAFIISMKRKVSGLSEEEIRRNDFVRELKELEELEKYDDEN